MTVLKTTRRRLQGALIAGTCGAAIALGVTPAAALSPLEYPDNGANAFSRAGAWLATATDPIAVHYNPAALATIGSAVSMDARLNYTRICFDRVDEDGNPTGPDLSSLSITDDSGLAYQNTCNARRPFPLAIPALAMTWRATSDIGVGIGFVPPSAYGTANEEWPALAPLYNRDTGEEQLGPSSYRYLTLGSQSTIAFPTASIGWEAFDDFRVGAGFIWGFGVINVYTSGIANASPTEPWDRAVQDSFSNLQTVDMFMPGFVASIHWSVTDRIDLSAWGRVVEGVNSERANLRTITNFYDDSPYDAIAPICSDDLANNCTPANENSFRFGPDDDSDGPFRFEFPYPPPEVRLGVRYHHPRAGTPSLDPSGYEVRDPLHDDVFDVELDGSYTWNSVADELVVRFPSLQNGNGILLHPTGAIPPIADRATGYKDSWGVRFGGQYNVMQDKLGLMAGTWYESESQEPALLTMSPAPGPARGGFGGGITFRQEFLDITFGYQYHWQAVIDNGGAGEQRAVAGVTTDPAGFLTTNEPLDLPAEERREFRSYHVINGGKITQSAHAFALGAVARF